MISLYIPSGSAVPLFHRSSALGAIFLAVSLWIFGFAATIGWPCILLFILLAIITGAYFNLITTHGLQSMDAGLGLAGGALINLALVFPAEPRFVIKYFLRWGGFCLACPCRQCLPDLFNFDQPTDYIQSWQYIYGFVSASAVFLLLTDLYHAFTINRQWSPIPRHSFWRSISLRSLKRLAGIWLYPTVQFLAIPLSAAGNLSARHRLYHFAFSLPANG